MLPTWVGARGLEFDWKFFQTSLDCNINMVSTTTTLVAMVMNLVADLWSVVMAYIAGWVDRSRNFIS